MSEKKGGEDCPSEEAPSQAESYDANRSGTSETYDVKDFCPGIRIEAKDFDGKWYPAKVSDVDWTENEILVHFENWNTKFDEWIPMDSSRLRSLQKPSLPQKEHPKYSKGEEVMAMWSPYQKYPATIQAVLPNDRYDVLFYDGFLKRLKSHKISKLEGETVKTEVRNFTDIGTKEERRERKRKINVAELFHINKRPKKKGLVHSKSQDIKTYPVTKSKNRGASLKKPVVPAADHSGAAAVSEPTEAHQKLPTSGTTGSTKALVDTIPAAFEVKYINGQTEMWSKQLYQRSEGRTAGKLDIVILNPQGRKFRSRNEIMKYCEENGIIYSHEAFDFSAKGRPKSKSGLQTTTPKLEPGLEDRDKFKKGQRRSQAEVSLSGVQGVAPPPIATDLLPGSEPVTDPNKVFIGDYEVVIENGKFICPVKTCAKHFRRENLLHMHMKHYHPEFSKYLDYTPSVTDLAYARTVGGLDATEVSLPAPRKSEKSEKPSNKAENVRKASDTSFEYSKEPKKMKLNDTRSETKAYSVKGFNESLVPSTDPGDIPADDAQKRGYSLAKNSSTSNDFSLKAETSSSAWNGNSLDIKSTESVASDSKSSASSHSVMKSLRHKLNSRKKAGRFQRSFAEHMRKKRFISQDHSKSHGKLNRGHQTQHLRQQLEQPPVLPPTSLPSQPFATINEVNPNATAQPQQSSRYPKPQMTITNEMSGKNHLLTTSFSPASGWDSNEQGIGSSSSSSSSTTSSSSTMNSSNDPNGKAKEHNRRNFLTGLINARKRRVSMSYRVRKKRKKATMNRIRASQFSQREFPVGPPPEANENATNAGVNGGRSPPETIRVDASIKEMFKKNLRLKLKRVDEDRACWVQSEPESDSGRMNGGLEQGPGESIGKTDLKSWPYKANDYEYLNGSETNALAGDVWRKDLYGDYGTRREHSGNFGGRSRHRAREKPNGKKGGKRVPGKRVRFEKTVLEKWIPVEEEGSQVGRSPAEGGEGGSRDEWKKKPTKGLEDQMRERETIVQVHGSDDVARNESLLPSQINSGLDLVEGAEDSKSALVVEDSKVEKLRRNEIINCLCGITEEDGLMIQCDLCLCWQHGHCAGILRESDVPDKYTCAICKNPYRARSSMKYLHDQEWLKEGTLPSLSFRSKREDVINQRKTILKRSHDLSGSIALLARVIHSLRLKVNIAEKKDHPKLWLWAKKWTEKKPNRLKEESDVKEEKPEPSLDVSNGVKTEGDFPEDEKPVPKAPEPEAPIDSAECKLNLLDHLIHYQTLVDARLSCIESLVAELESMQDDAVNDEAPDRYPRTKATVQMILRDLNTMKKIAII